MIKNEINFFIEVRNNVIVKIGKSCVYHPAAQHNNNDGIKWFDDSKLIKSQE